MNIETALTITNTRNRKQLAEFLGFSQPSAVYQWPDDEIPGTGVQRIAEALGVPLPCTEQLIYKHLAINLKPSLK